MKTFAVMVVAAALAAACAAPPPPPNPALEEARATYKAASSDPKVNAHARLELTRAEESLRAAEAEHKQGGDAAAVSHLAYLAKQRALIAEERAELAAAEEMVRVANAERDRVMLEARTRALQSERQQTARAEQRAQAAEQQAQSTEQRAAVAEQHARALQDQARSAEEQARTAQEQARAAAERAGRYQSELQELQAKQTPHGMVITLGDVLFDTGKATLKPGAARSIDRLAEFLKQYPERKVRVGGFTDSTGSEEVNQKLSEQRATAVRQALLERGVAPERIEAVGFGPAFPVATNGTAAGRQLNRRVEIVVSDERGNVAARR